MNARMCRWPARSRWTVVAHRLTSSRVVARRRCGRAETRNGPPTPEDPKPPHGGISVTPTSSFVTGGTIPPGRGATCIRPSLDPAESVQPVGVSRRFRAAGLSSVQEPHRTGRSTSTNRIGRSIAIVWDRDSASEKTWGWIQAASACAAVVILAVPVVVSCSTMRTKLGCWSPETRKVQR